MFFGVYLIFTSQQQSTQRVIWTEVVFAHWDLYSYLGKGCPLCVHYTPSNSKRVRDFWGFITIGGSQSFDTGRPGWVGCLTKTFISK